MQGGFLLNASHPIRLEFYLLNESCPLNERCVLKLQFLGLRVRLSQTWELGGEPVLLVTNHSRWSFKIAIFAFIADDFKNATICPLSEQSFKMGVLTGVFFPQNGSTGVDSIHEFGQSIDRQPIV
jgi:hypothetical protein